MRKRTTQYTDETLNEKVTGKTQTINETREAKRKKVEKEETIQHRTAGNRYKIERRKHRNRKC